MSPRRVSQPGFSRTQAGVEASFDMMEAGVLRRLARDIETLLDVQPSAGPVSDDPLEALLAGMGEGPTEPPQDPVLARLLPDAYSGDDPEASSEFRRFTDGELRAGKVANAQLLRELLPSGGGHVCLTDEQATAALSGINDLRLSLGTALEVTDDSYAEYARLDPLSHRARRLFLYHWLGMLQETLLEAISDE